MSTEKLKAVYYALDDLHDELLGSDDNLELARHHIKEAKAFVRDAANRDVHAEAQSRFESDWERRPNQDKGPQP